jgi:hypothetical protein
VKNWPIGVKREVRKVDLVVLGKNEQISKSLEQAVEAYHLKCVTSHFLVSWLISDKGIDLVFTFAFFFFFLSAFLSSFLFLSPPHFFRFFSLLSPFPFLFLVLTIHQEKYRVEFDTQNKKQKVEVIEID